MLDEVVVIGYGSVKKKDLLGSISTVKEDALAERVSGNVVEAMRGLTSGVKLQVVDNGFQCHHQHSWSG